MDRSGCCIDRAGASGHDFNPHDRKSGTDRLDGLRLFPGSRDSSATRPFDPLGRDNCRDIDGGEIWDRHLDDWTGPWSAAHSGEKHSDSAAVLAGCRRRYSDRTTQSNLAAGPRLAISRVARKSFGRRHQFYRDTAAIRTTANSRHERPFGLPGSSLRFFTRFCGRRVFSPLGSSQQPRSSSGRMEKITICFQFIRPCSQWEQLLAAICHLG